MTGEFLKQLDTAIMSGLSSSRVARLVGVGETTVRRRKKALASEGHSFPNALGIRPEEPHAVNNQ